MQKKDLQSKSMINLPVILLRGIVLFPNMKLSFDIGRKKSLSALNQAINTDQTVFIVSQKNVIEDDPNIEDLYDIGVVAKVKQVVNQPGNRVHLLVEGKSRAKLCYLTQQDPFITANVLPMEQCNAKPLTSEEKAAVRTLKSILNQYIQLSPNFSPSLISEISLMSCPSDIADCLAANILENYEDRQAILSIKEPLKRIEKLILLLLDELEVLSIEEKLNIKLINDMEQNKREFYLREQIRVISEELGLDEENEADILRKKVLGANLPDLAKETLLKECDRISKIMFGSPELGVLINYVETCLSLPWNKKTIENINLDKAKKILDKDHFGLDKIKENILETLAIRKIKPDIKGQILCLVGPPGVGKTSIAKSIARAINRNFERVSLGGVHDEAEIRGHRKTYIGAMPGRIISAISSSKSSNPLILLDEIDKLTKDVFGDPVSALLEVLDSEQNFSFHDHYIDMPFDISQVLFITTANDIESIPYPLLDRMDIIELSSYTHEEKFNIAKKYLIPKQLLYFGIDTKNFKIKDNAIRDMIDFYTHEAGVRALERVIISLIKKSAKNSLLDENKKVIISPKDLENLLGPIKFKKDVLNKTDEIGSVMGLAWTKLGGEILPIEVAVMKGTGKLELTGSLGDVMKESAKAAISYVRSNSEMFNIDPNFYTKLDIHVHVPHGAIPKDGPSAGVTIATAMISALSLRKVRRNVAMTGEITLRGNILAVGGLKEKIMAALRAGIDTVILPRENEPDLAELNDELGNKIKFILAENLEEVIKNAIIF